jgi:hypothetical protein
MAHPKYAPKDAEGRFFHLIEELGELQAAIGKTLRWGIFSVNPELPEGEQESNGLWVLREMDDVLSALAACRADIVKELEQ